MAIHFSRPTVTQVLVGVFLPLVSGTGLLVAWIDVRRMNQLLTSASEDLVQARAEQLRISWAQQVDPAVVSLDLELLEGVAQSRGEERWRAALPQFQQALARTPLITAYFAAWGDGSLLRVARVRQLDGRRLGGAPAAAALVVDRVDRQVSPPQLQRQAFDARLRPLGLVPVALPASTDARQSLWYRLAQEGAGATVLSPLQHLPLSGGMGLTLSRRLPDGGGVVGASVLVANLESLLARFRVTPGTQVAVVDAAGRLFLTPGDGDESDLMKPLAASPNRPLAAMAPLLERLRRQSGSFREPPRLRSFVVERESWFGAVVGIPDLQGQGQGGTYLLMAVPADELLAGPRRALREAELATLLVVLLAAPLVVLVARRIARPLRQLADQASRLRAFEFANAPPVASMLQEVHGLGRTLDGMRHTIRTFLQSSAALGAEPDVERLLQRLLVDAIHASGAASGVLYRADEADPEAPLRAVLASDAAAPALAPQPQAEPPLPQAELEASDDPTLLRLPLRSRDGRLQGALALRFTEPPQQARVAFCRALSGSAAVALETRSLIAAQKALFEAFVQLLADAIDAKSPYTGGHCARVPELARALAQAACEADGGPFADFQLSPRDWEALHLASWLHDCGKVTTPEFVVDKATKLETLYDRIHEVRMRFELLKATAEIDHWRAVAQGGDAEALAANLQAAWTELDAEFAFVAACNLGGEAMESAQVQRLEGIAARRWRRTLDDRLGLSADERRRCATEPEVTLPTWEPLLSDRPRHRIERLPGQRLPAENPWGFTLQEPELLYDRGELTNLRIGRGTLTAEERYKINEHIIQTIRMLEALPFPPHLRDVPEIAGGHHERMDGRGYPRSLSAERLSPLARMMAIADVFEALTASDRPYKSGKPLSVALSIMASMVREQHLDPDLFELFLRAGVHRRYAEQFLDPSQSDAVDEAALLARARGS